MSQRIILTVNNIVKSYIEANPEVSQIRVRRRIINGIHSAYSDAGIPRSQNGSRLGLRKRVILHTQVIPAGCFV